ncbi:manganese transporter [Actinoplanes sp. SE50]|uniref:metal ABC transporter permease n=1 Tax=unclassified Actinoplanes TaxID=2626549 RepID=UPI00023ED527|nr:MULTISPECIES: metal ABC transporter permease [unclassified Actinoplanes]AEV81165.1 Chelated iron transport system membrane protein yfeD [Actinoplanes sp. SE50/110]ATO79566.1 manganese transporter [Actinoplanes sp. SE50]SLL96967.1 manganese transporter [Actinoplanes sp. SE50/110]
MIEPFAAPFMARALTEIALLALICGPVSVFVFARRLSFVSDALTHTIFPGVVVGFLAGGIEGLFAGALVAGVVTALVLTLLTRGGRISDDAATAVVLTAMFSIGVALVSRRASYTADLTSFLFGRLLTVSPRQIAETAVLVVVVLAALLIGARALLFRTFDPAGAAAAGFRVGWLDLGLNILVALVVVAAVRAVGTILVVALLIVPAAAGRMVTDRLVAMAILGTVLVLGAGYGGLWLSWTASMDYGVSLTAASAVVLLLVAAYCLLIPVRWIRDRRRRRHVPLPRQRSAAHELVG